MDDARNLPVAYLFLHQADDAKSSINLSIQANDEFDLGREQVNSILGVNDGTISKHHLRIHCVTYDENPVAAIEPLVYVRILSHHGARLSQTALNGSNSTCFLPHGHPSVLLNHGDSIHLSSNVSVKYQAVPRKSNQHKHMSSIAQAEAKLFDKQYTITSRVLGVGGFASVFLAINMKSRRQVACKVVPLPKKPPFPCLSEWEAQPGRTAPAREASCDIVRHRKICRDLRREFEVLKGIDHPNIVRLEKAMYAADHIYIFQELVSGGDLMSYLEMKGGLDEPEAAVMIFQLLKALEYLHGRGIVHRDIKPENILLTSWRKGARIVLTDFGQSRRFVEGKNSSKTTQISSQMNSLVGTHGYVAPEVYMRPSDDDARGQSGYNEAVDIWSIGCLAGSLLTNTFLFPHGSSSHSERSDKGKTTDASLAFSLEFLDTSEDWQRMSRKSKSFIRGCAMVDDSQRLTVSQALQHPWVAHPGFAEAMHAEYARATADWVPRANANNLIEYVKDPLPVAKTPETGYETRLHDEVRSHHFQSQMPPMPSQLRTFDASFHTGRSLQARLSPVDSSSLELPKKATTHTSLTTSDSDLGRSTFGLSNKRRGQDEMSYLSIQDYAPPVIYQAATPRERTPQNQGTWDMQLAEAMDIDGRSDTASTILPHNKRSRL